MHSSAPELTFGEKWAQNARFVAQGDNFIIRLKHQSHNSLRKNGHERVATKDTYKPGLLDFCRV